MAWIKRNLFFVVGGVVTLALLGAAGFYIFKSWNRNAVAFESLNEVVGTLKNLADQKPSPGNDKIDNTKAAKEQDAEMRKWIEATAIYFRPIAPIPSGPVNSESFSGALRKTIDQMQKSAEAAGVVLPPKYDFSFAAERPLVKFAPGLDLLAVQLGEVKAITDILFAAKINALDSIQRVRVTDDDLLGPQSDYTDQKSITNDLAIITPYILTFRCFTPELSRVLAGFTKAENTFIIKTLNVQPASAPLAPSGVAGGMPGMPGAPGGLYGEGVPGMRIPGEGIAMPQPSAAPPIANRGGLPTVLREQLLRVTAEVYLVKLTPKK